MIHTFCYNQIYKFHFPEINVDNYLKSNYLNNKIYDLLAGISEDYALHNGSEIFSKAYMICSLVLRDPHPEHNIMTKHPFLKDIPHYYSGDYSEYERYSVLDEDAYRVAKIILNYLVWKDEDTYYNAQRFLNSIANTKICLTSNMNFSGIGGTKEYFLINNIRNGKLPKKIKYEFPVSEIPKPEKLVTEGGYLDYYVLFYEYGLERSLNLWSSKDDIYQALDNFDRELIQEFERDTNDVNDIYDTYHIDENSPEWDTFFETETYYSEVVKRFELTDNYQQLCNMRKKIDKNYSVQTKCLSSLNGKLYGDDTVVSENDTNQVYYDTLTFTLDNKPVDRDVFRKLLIDEVPKIISTWREGLALYDFCVIHGMTTESANKKAFVNDINSFSGLELIKYDNCKSNDDVVFHKPLKEWKIENVNKTMYCDQTKFNIRKRILRALEIALLKR